MILDVFLREEHEVFTVLTHIGRLLVVGAFQATMLCPIESETHSPIRMQPAKCPLAELVVEDATNELELLIERIILCYRKNIREVTVQIENAKKALALTAAANLEAFRETYDEHLIEINQMKMQLAANDPKMTTMIDSYRRGFMKGITAVTMNFIHEHK